MKHNEDGAKAEQKVADYLKEQGYDVVEQNWKTTQCEIDIIAKKDGRVQFFEVKYRRTDAFGSGFDYITKAKQRQMHFAAQYWAAAHQWEGEVALGAASVSGTDYAVELIDIL